MKIEITHATGTAPLYYFRGNEINPQPAYLYLRCDEGRLWAAADQESPGSEAASVYFRRIVRWRINPLLTPDAINSLLQDVTTLASRVCAGADTDVDENGNEIGIFDDLAIAAMEEIEKLANDTFDADETDTYKLLTEDEMNGMEIDDLWPEYMSLDEVIDTTATEGYIVDLDYRGNTVRDYREYLLHRARAAGRPV